MKPNVFLKGVMIVAAGVIFSMVFVGFRFNTIHTGGGSGVAYWYLEYQHRRRR